MILRPYAVVLAGELASGLEVLVEEGRVAEVRGATGPSDDYVLSPAFVNAHSHLEYRGLIGGVEIGGYWEFIRSITDAKRGQSLEDVADDARWCAIENVGNGVAWIAEHSDRPVAGRAMQEAGLDGVVFQEVITFFERESPAEKLAECERRAAMNRAVPGAPVYLSPHAPHTVDPDTLAALASRGGPLSVHVAETEYETAWIRDGRGPIADFMRAHGVQVEPTGESVARYMDRMGFARPGVQWVHCCALEPEDVALLADSGVSVAHCPRSNVALGCPDAPIRELLDAGVLVGLGMDSAASSGPTDVFAEMRAALECGVRRGRSVEPSEVWRMATEMGAASLGVDDWGIAPGARARLLEMHVAGASSTRDLIERGSASHVRRVAL